MKIVKFSFPYPKFPVTRQTSNSLNVWRDYQFVMNDDTLKEADYWVVFEDLLSLEEKVICPKENTIFITGEGTATGGYDIKALSQFNHIITCQKQIRLPNTHYFHTANPWFVGKSYQELITQKEVKKTKQISVICSNVQLTEGHRLRYNFCLRLKEYFGDRIDLFGRGIRDFEDKWEVLADYKYSVVIENSVEENWFTEKLYDCFLAHTFPFYHGCPNITDYFSEKSFFKIDINNFEETIKSIESVLNDENHYEQCLEDIIEAKNTYLNNYNIYPLITNFIEKNNLDRYTNKVKVCIKSRNNPHHSKISLKQHLRNLFRKIPILGNIWYYRNLGLEHEKEQKEQKIQKEQELKAYLRSNDYIQYHRCEPWFAAHGDKKLNLTCNGLDNNSVVFDLGGYEGQWASDIFAKYLCNIFIFEPYKEYANNITQRFLYNDKIKVFDFGLAHQTFTSKLSSSNNASSMFITNAENFVEIQLVKAMDFLKENNITQIDLLKMNIEGGEYDLLEHLIDTGFIINIKNIKVQFHDFIIENAKQRMNNIQEKLSITHKLIYQYEFVWEHWELK